MGDFDEMIPEYVAESTDLLATVETGLLNLEEGGMDEESIHSVFRAIHSIKGGAGFVGLHKIERLAHRMEDLLNLVRNGDLAPEKGITSSLLNGLDILNSLFENIEDEDSIDIEGPIAALDQALAAAMGQEEAERFDAPGTPNPAAGMPEFQVKAYTLAKKLNQGNVYFMRLDMAEVEKQGLTPIRLVNEMLSMGELLDSQVDLGAAGDENTYEVDSVRFGILYATVLEADLLSAALKLDESCFKLVTAADFDLDGGEMATLHAPAAPPEEKPAAPAPRPAPVQAAPKPAPKPVPPPAPANPAPASNPAPAAADPAPALANPAPAPPEAAPVLEVMVDDTREGEYLTFILGEETYGVDILSVQEIMGIPHLARIPNAPDHVLGVMNLRGMVVPVMDLRTKLGLDPLGSEQVVVVVRVGEKIQGLVVDGVRDVIWVKEDDVQDAPEFSGVIRKEYLIGLTRVDKEMIILLGLERLMAPENMGHAA